MRIGVDVRLLTRPLTGIGRYTHEMINALLRADADLILYAPGPLIHPLHKSTGRYLDRPGFLSKGGASRFLWAHTVLPYQVRKDHLDIFWGPAHRLPAGLPRQIRACLTIHDLVWRFAGETMRPASRLMEELLMPPALQRADKIIAVSHHTRDDIRRSYPDIRADVATIYPGGAPRPLGYDAEYLSKWNIAGPYILFVGTLEPRKNLPRLLQAYAALPEQVKGQACLVIAGGRGWGGVDLPAMVETFGLQQGVRLTGYVDERELSTLYENALFVAMPSLYEGFGLPLAEALHYRLPVLTADVSSMPEVAGEAGLLIDPLQVKSITMGLQQLITSSSLRAQLANAAEQQAKQFSWDIAAKQMLQLFANP